MSNENVASQIRFLVENFYDIQKLRVEAFNRIVAYVKSQVIFDPQSSNASQNKLEAQSSNASHAQTEAQMANASHYKFEPYEDNASQQKIESHVEHASHDKSDPQYISAVKPSEIAHKIVKGEIKVPREIADLVWYHNSLLETEKELAKRLDGWSKHHPIRIHFLSKVKGIGPILASGLIAWLTPISRFPNVSKLWAYCGLAPGQERKKGKKLSYNPKLKTLMWKVWSQFVKCKSFGRKLYLENKEYCKAKHPDWTKLHIHNWAGRKTVKIFLACLWTKWRQLEGLSVTKPYAIQFLGHSDLITPEMWMEKP